MGFYEEINEEILPSEVVHYMFAAAARGGKVWRDGKAESPMTLPKAVVAEFIEKEGRVEFEKPKKMGICQSAAILDD
jgi:hypothetical protein